MEVDSGARIPGLAWGVSFMPVNDRENHSETKKPLVLHIGLQKTGTSSIQVMLSKSEVILREAGYVYPSLPKNSGKVWNSPFRHNILASTYADFPSVFDKLDACQEEEFWSQLASSSLTPILSAEEFSRLQRVDRLADKLSRFNVHFIAFLRRQDLLAESLYNQRNKILLSRKDPGLLKSDLLSETSLFEFLRIENYVPLLNYHRLLKEFIAKISPGKVDIRAFERGQLPQGDVCLGFLELLGLDISGMQRHASEANGSICNDTLGELINAYQNEGSKTAGKMMSEVCRNIEAGKDYSGNYRILSFRTRKAMLEQYAEINGRIESDFGVKFERLSPDGR